jgi:hypothetical protein
VRSEKLVAEAGTFREPRGRGTSAAEAATKQRLVKTEKTLSCAVFTGIFGASQSVRLS